MSGPPRDPRNPFDERAIARATILTIVVCAATGAGIGVFFAQPALGSIAGAVVGIVIGALLIPRLMRDWREWGG